MSLFIVTLGDVIGIVFFCGAILIFGVCFFYEVTAKALGNLWANIKNGGTK